MGSLSETIDARLKELGIPGSKMCDDLGMSRSTLTELRKGRASTLKAEKAAAIASYLSLSVEELIGGKKPEPDKAAGWYPPDRFWKKINEDRPHFLHCLLEAWDAPLEDIESIWHVPAGRPDEVPEEVFRRFVQGVVKAVRFDLEDHAWDIILNPQREKASAPESGRFREDEIKAAFFKGADPTITEEEMDVLWEDARSYMQYRLQQRNKKLFKEAAGG